MSDLISRQAAINRIESHIRTGDELYPLTDTDKILNHAFEIAASCVYNLPSVQERKGRWVDCVGSDHWKCSECGDRAPMYWDANRQEYDEWFSPYCPHCGAKMEGAEDAGRNE